jgi:uncharacterized BrkB/YihY/UPF0761 family membrane protein
MSVDEIDRLARRIHWLDRNRRRLSVGIAAVLVAPLFMLFLILWLPPQWPKIHAACVAIAIASASWYGIETALGLLQAVWETDHGKLTGPAELPRAKLVDRRK